MESIKQIRAAVTANRGGFKDASDQQILAIWRHLDEATRQQYLKSVTTKDTETDIRNKK